MNIRESRKWVGTEEIGHLKILQWNILAQTLSGEDAGFPCSPEFLEFDHRFSKIIQEIVHYKPEVICLQEVDIFEDISTELLKHGYKGIFVAKPNSPCLKFKVNRGPDGNAIFYKEDTLALLSNENTILNATNSTLLRANFIHKETKVHFTVLTTHLKSKSEFSQIRLKQTRSISEELKKLKHTNYIICGDFNADPSEPFYKLLTEEIGLISVFQAIFGHELAYTTWKKRNGSYVKKMGEANKETKKVEDYIFYHPANISCCNILDLPLENCIGSDLLPCKDYTSDHLSLMATLKFNVAGYIKIQC